MKEAQRHYGHSVSDDLPSANLIVDNYGTHTEASVKAWLEKHPRFTLHFTPTSSSWLNLVERWFRELTEKRVRRGSFESVPQRFERGELRQVSEDYLYELRTLLSGIVSKRAAESSDRMGGQASTGNVLGDIDYLLTTCFGVEMVVLRPIPPSSG